MYEELEDLMVSPLPFAQIVQSQAYQIDNSIALSQNQGGLNYLLALQNNIQSVKQVLSDSSISESDRVKESLKILERGLFHPVQSILEIQDKQALKGKEEKQESLQSEPTINIIIESQEEFNCPNGLKKTGKDYHQEKQDPKSSSNAYQELDHLRGLLHQKEKETTLLKEEKKQAEAQFKREISLLTRELEISQQKNSSYLDPKKGSKLHENQEIGKMNKWLETMNKLLQNAQRQATSSKEQLKRSQQASTKHLTEKEEQIKLLREQLTDLQDQKKQHERVVLE